ncbi:MAG: cation/multidrug efflux pump [Cellvibrionaceae bacterium]
MGYLLLTVIFVLIAAVLAFWSTKLLFKNNWLMGWLRGTAGLLLVFGVIIVGCMAFDIYSYRQLTAEQNIATISFKSLDNQHYSATFVEANGQQQNFELYGDQWQLDSRIIKWNGLVSRLGMKTGYRLDRISGRYLLLDEERTKKRSVYTVSQSVAGVDVWDWLKGIDIDSIVDARYGNSTFLPMVEGAQYQISVTTSGLLARPLNDPARKAVDQWR